MCMGRQLAASPTYPLLTAALVFFSPLCCLAFPSLVSPFAPSAEFRGPPDPMRGDEPYRKVRDAAKDALEAMFDTTPPVSMAGTGSMAGISGGGPGAGAGGSGAFPSPYPPASGASAFPSPYPSAGGARPGGFSTALPGQPGYDPSSPFHGAPITTGTMVRGSEAVCGCGAYGLRGFMAFHCIGLRWGALGGTGDRDGHRDMARGRLT